MVTKKNKKIIRKLDKQETYYKVILFVQELIDMYKKTKKLYIKKKKLHPEQVSVIIIVYIFRKNANHSDGRIILKFKMNYVHQSDPMS